MQSPHPRKQADILRRALYATATALLLFNAVPTEAANVERLVEMGRRIYVEGMLPDGTPLTATRFEGSSAISGAEAACINCHRPSGYGSFEGGLLVPPVSGAVLFAPGVFAPSATGGGKGDARASVPAVERFRLRSAYNERSLRRALRDGIDPDGRPLQPLMAHYDLDAQAVRALSAYLRRLSSKPSPGVVGETLHLAAVITPDVPPQQREAVLEVLRAYAATRNWQLHVWELVGAPQGWKAQLDRHYRRQPVFALLSGAGRSEWQPVHRFCEHRAVACVLPSVELAPDIEREHYSFYFSSGLALEAQLLAHQLAAEPAPPRRLYQIVADDSGKRAARVLELALAQAGSPIEVQQMRAGQYAAMAQPPAGDAAVWWLRPEQIAGLISARPGPPRSSPIYLSALLAPQEELVIPEGWKQSLRYVSAFDPLAALRAQSALVPWLERQGLAATSLRLRGDAYAACNFFNSAITTVQLESVRGIPGPLTRERLLEALEANLTLFRDDGAPYYWQLSSGPGLRLLTRGGALLRYAGPDETDWEVDTARIVP